MPNRNMQDANGYRYGYQGEFAETDPETGKPAFELRLYDPRINRWLSPDPVGQYNSPYLAMGNDWANGVDPNGGWKTKFGAWLWKTFNGGGEIVGEKGNWSVAQQGADGWDTFITNGEFDSFGYTSINSITTQVNSNTLIDYNTVTQEAKYKFLYPNDLGDWNTKGSDGKYWIGCLSCHSDSGAYRYAAYNSKERFDGIAIAATFDAVGLPLITAPRSTTVNGKRVVAFTSRTTNRAGKPNNGVALTLEDGSTMDITAFRVKQKIPNTHPKAPFGAMQNVKFDNAIPGTKGLKRVPTQGEIDLLNSYIDFLNF